MSLIHKEIRWLHKLRNSWVTKAVSGPQGSEEQYGFVSAVIDAGDPVGRWWMDLAYARALALALQVGLLASSLGNAAAKALLMG